MSIPRLLSQHAFNIGLLVVLLVALSAARHWPDATRLFPSVIGIPTALLVALVLATDWRNARKSLAPEAGSAEDPVAIRELTVFGWLIGYVLLVWLLGFYLAAGVFLFVFCRRYFREGWRTAAVMALAAGALAILLFHVLLQTIWPVGVLFDGY